MLKIAVPYENGNIFQHFGHTARFKIYEVEDNAVFNSFVIDTDGNGHGALADFLLSNGVKVLVCGGIGGGAQTALANVGIQLFGGVQGNADDAVQALLGGTLKWNPTVRCTHHHDHAEGHSCGNHGCGGHSCH